MNNFLVHLDMGRIGYVIEAETKEGAAKTATQRAYDLVINGTCSHNYPRVIAVDHEPYKAPPVIVRTSGGL